MAKERSIKAVPVWAVLLLVTGLTLQCLWHDARPGPQVRADALPPPLSLNFLRVASLGEPWVTSKFLSLWLQVFDNQPGISIPFQALDYDKVEGWLGRSLDLDPRVQYPMLAATRLYGGVSNEAKKRQMFEFAYRRFLERPNARWRWLAHAAIESKHRLKDPELALKFAQAITTHATGPEVPYWAKHMSVIILQDMGEFEAAALLIFNLLESDLVPDPHEQRFLAKKLEELNADSAGNRQE